MRLNDETWLNELWCGDNIDVLKQIPDESVDLIYIDPPFFSNRHYEVIWGNGAELRSFGDRWKGGIEHYVGWMVPRLKELHRILKKTGSIYVHLDWHAVHYLKIEMDKIFGYDNLRNEIIWSYKRYTAASTMFQRLHDTILFYGKGKNGTFNTIREPYGEKSGKADSHYKQDKDGRWFRWQKRKGKDPYKVYLSEGRRVGDVWEIPLINSTSKERIGYPTQKPEALLERIIKASSNEGDIVLDAFCGCGTTIAMAEKLNRKWIGLDVSPIAVKVMTERLIAMEEKLGKKLEDFITYGLPEKTIAHLRKMSGADFEDFIIQQINGKASPSKVHDYGIDGYTKDGIPVQAKNWGNSVGRNVVDNFHSAVRREGKKKGQIYAMKYAKGAHEEAARLKREDGIEIELIEMKEFLIEKYGDHTHRK